MRPQPVSGGKQRGAELSFFIPVLKFWAKVPSPSFINILFNFILNAYRNEKTNLSPAATGSFVSHCCMAE